VKISQAFSNFVNVIILLWGAQALKLTDTLLRCDCLPPIPDVVPLPTKRAIDKGSALCRPSPTAHRLVVHPTSCGLVSDVPCEAEVSGSLSRGGEGQNLVVRLAWYQLIHTTSIRLPKNFSVQLPPRLGSPVLHFVRDGVHREYCVPPSETPSDGCLRT
jgi:hypothetical protein